MGGGSNQLREVSPLNILLKGAIINGELFQAFGSIWGTLSKAGDYSKCSLLKG